MSSSSASYLFMNSSSSRCCRQHSPPAHSQGTKTNRQRSRKPASALCLLLVSQSPHQHAFHSFVYLAWRRSTSPSIGKLISGSIPHELTGSALSSRNSCNCHSMWSLCCHVSQWKTISKSNRFRCLGVSLDPSLFLSEGRSAVRNLTASM